MTEELCSIQLWCFLYFDSQLYMCRDKLICFRPGLEVDYYYTNKLIRFGEEGGGVEKKMPFHYWLSIPKKKPLPLQKVMHTRKRHMELFQELNQKFQTLDRFRDIPNMGSMVSNRKPGGWPSAR